MKNYLVLRRVPEEMLRELVASLLYNLSGAWLDRFWQVVQVLLRPRDPD
jgi:hypothetical protein